MGINIDIYDKDCNSPTDWDYARNGYDNYFLENFLSEIEVDNYDDIQEGFRRPKFFDPLTRMVDRWDLDIDNKKRYYQFIELLKCNKKLYYAISW